MFSSFALRLKKLPESIRSIVSLQISQISYNAENRDMMPIPITPLPSLSVSQYPVTSLSTSNASEDYYSTSDIISSAYQIAQL